MRTTLAIVLGGSLACVASTMPSHADPFSPRPESRQTRFQTCYPSIVNPILYTCNGQGVGSAWHAEKYGGTAGPSVGNGKSCG
jgi:hypothetical protein